MALNKDRILEKTMNGVEKVSNNTYVQSVSRGMAMVLPLLMVGSLVLLLTKIPIAAWQNIVNNTSASTIFTMATQFTTNLLAVWAVFFIGNRLGNTFHYDGALVGIMCLLSFFLLTPMVESEGTKYISTEWLGAKGVFVAIIVALVIGRFYVLIMDHKLYIRMPDTVPAFVEKSFAAIIPFFFITVLSGVVAHLFSLTSFGSIHGFIYGVLQTPLQAIGSSLGGVIVAYIITNILWLLGVHGKALVFSVVLPMWSAATAENLAAAQAGLESPHIIDLGFTTIFMEIGGAGCVLALCLLMLFTAKSQQFKSLGKMFFIPTLCGISEPIHFGTPLVMNLKFALPFITAPIVSGVLGYVATLAGLVPRMVGTTVPTGTPQILNGFLIGGVRGMIMQIIVLVVCMAIYYPFFRAVDCQAYQEEQGAVDQAA